MDLIITLSSSPKSNRLETNFQERTNDAEAHRRRVQCGFNELEAPSEELSLKFIGCFRGPILHGEFYQPLSTSNTLPIRPDV
ncbi:cation-transporting P-type ATPase [Escherichia coli]|uniref:cation-transporting P-type ATPase n=1 Tax=Escherichia coli TaxID=562 RepID=UPI00336C16B1